MNFIRQLNFHSIQLHLTVRRFLEDRKGELDEKAILIAFFVIVVAAAVVLLGYARQQHVSPARQYGVGLDCHANLISRSDQSIT